MTELIFLLNHIRVGRFGADELYLGGAGAFVREGVAGGDDFPVARPESEPAAPRLVAVDFEARVRHDGYVVDREVGEIGSGGTAADASRSFRAPGEGFVDLPRGDTPPAVCLEREPEAGRDRPYPERSHDVFLSLFLYSLL